MAVHKVGELSGALLDLAVAVAEGKTAVAKWNDASASQPDEGCAWVYQETCYIGSRVHRRLFRPSTNPTQGQPIAEKYGICCRPHVAENGVITSWAAGRIWPMDDAPNMIGATELEARMRVVVASKYGETIELPDI